jgi:transcriptional regulator with XRE-family HTH domain
MNTLPTTLRAWRGNATQREAAEALGVSLRTYQKWEIGRMPDPSTLALLLRLIAFIKPENA